MPFDRMMLLIIVIAVVVLVAAVVYLIIRLCKTLNVIHAKLDAIGDEPKKLVENINNISEDLNEKLKLFNPIFRAINNVGEGLEFKSLHFKDKSFWKSFRDKIDYEVEEAPKSDNKFDDIVDLAVSGFNLWRKIKG